MKGPAPQPTKLKVLRGNPGKRALNNDEPVFEAAEDVVPPAVLTETGRAEFYRVAEQLLNNGLLTVADVVALTVYCKAWERFVEAEEFLNSHGLYFIQSTESGGEIFKAYPQVAISNAAAGIIDKYASKFGFTPADRSRIKAQRPGDGPAKDSVYD